MFFAFRVLMLSLSILSTALAAPRVLPGGPIIGDGQTEVELRIWIPGLAPDDNVRVKPEHGRVRETKVATNGIVTVHWTPGKIEIAESTPVKVSVRGATSVDTALTVDLLPPRAGRLALSFDPPLWRDGVGPIQVKIKLDGSSPQASMDRTLLLRANAGTISEAQASGPNEWTAQWTQSSSITGSRFIIIGAADPVVPSEVYGFGVLAVQKQQSLSFGATPGSKNTLKLGGNSYGPMVSSPQGTVAFNIPVDPREVGAQLLSVLPDGRKLKMAVEVPVPAFPRVSLLPQPASIPAGKGLTVRIAAISANGKPSDAALVRLVAEGQDLGEIAYAKQIGIFNFEVPIVGGTRPFSLVATLRDGASTAAPEKQVDELSISRAPALPQTRLKLSPAHLSGQDRYLSVEAMGLDTNNMPTPMEIKVHMSPGTVYGRPIQSEAATVTKYRLPTDTSRAWVVVEPPMPTSNAPAANLLMWATEGTAEFGTELPVLLAVTDANGTPIAGATVQLSTSGGGVLPESVTTSANGLAIATYTAGQMAGWSTLHASSAGFIAELGIFQGTSALPESLPASDPLARALIAGLAPSFATAIAGSEPVVAAVAAPIAAPTPVAAATPIAAATPAPPAATVAAAEPPKRATKAKETNPTGAFGPPTLRAVGAVGFVTRSYTQVRGSKSPRVPPSASYSHVSPALDLRGVYWVNQGPWGAAGRVRISTDSIEIGADTFKKNAWALHAGGRYRGEIEGNWQWFALAELHRTGSSVVQYKDEAQDAAIAKALPLVGLRMGGGLSTQLEGRVPLYLEATLAETFGVAPVNTYFGFAAAYPFNDQWSVRLDNNTDLIHAKVDVAGSAATLSQTDLSTTIGVQFTGL